MLAGPAPESSRCGVKSFGHQCWIILDGQQRSLTLRLILIAISDEIKRQTGKYPAEIDRDAVCSIQVHGLDEADWSHIQQGKTASHREHSIDQPDGKLQICDAYLFIRWVLMNGASALTEEEPTLPPPPANEILLQQWESFGEDLLKPDELLAIAENILTKLELSLLIHEDTDEAVEVIFESLNGLRTELGQYDLFRNFILTQANVQGVEQRNLYTEMMQDPEQVIDRARLDFKEEKGNLQIFLSDFVLMRPGLRIEELKRVTRSNSCQRFKEWWQHQTDKQPNLRDFIEHDLSLEMRSWLAATSGERVVSLASGQKFDLPQAAVRSVWRIEMFSRGTYTPLVTLAINTWTKSSEDDRDQNLCGILKALETTLARQVLTGGATRHRRNQMLEALPRGVGRDLNATEVWVGETAPDDYMVQRVALQSANTSFAQARNREDWFEPKELFQRTRSRALIGLFDGLVQYRDGLDFSTVLALKPGTRVKGNKVRTIEHFCPQGYLASEEWMTDFRNWGVEQDEIESRLHSIGNLTVLPLKINAAWQRSRASKKRAELQTEPFPSLKINREFENCERWGPEQIDARSESLVKDCLSFWAIPDLKLVTG